MDQTQIVKREIVRLYFKKNKTETNKTALAIQEKTEKFLYSKVTNCSPKDAKKKDAQCHC